MRECWNRQTGTFEVRVSSTYGFKSHFAHQKESSIFSIPFLLPKAASPKGAWTREGFEALRKQSCELFLAKSDETGTEYVVFGRRVRSMQGFAAAGGHPISRTMKTVKTFVLAVFILSR